MYVVVGATGNTGSVVAKQLIACAKTVRVIGRTADRLQPLADLGAKPFVADIADGRRTRQRLYRSASGLRHDPSQCT